MKPSNQPSDPYSENKLSEQNLSLEFAKALLEVEDSLVTLKARFEQVERDRNLQAELKQRASELENSKVPEMQAELKEIKAKIEVLEINLATQLFSWSTVKRPFWQIVRFGGLGVIIGWILKYYTG